MSDLWKLEDVDVDGAIREAADKVDPVTRASFLRKAGVGVGSVAVGGGILAALPAAALAATPASDVAILNFALTLEYLEAAFYAEAVKNASVFKGDTRNFADVVSKHEAAHVAFLKKALGSAAVKSPKFDFKGTTQDQAKFEATSQALEDTGVTAYSGQGPLIKTPAIAAAAISILTVEARHASWMRHIRQESPAPATFDKPKTKAQVLTAVKATGFIVG